MITTPPNPRVLVIGSVWPEPDSSAAGWRMLSLLQVLRAQNWTVQFASAAGSGEHPYDLASLQIESIPIQLNHDSFDQFIAATKPDLVIFDRFMTEEQFGWRVRQQAPNALCILDTEDLHALREARQLACKTQRELRQEDLFSDKACREIASMLRCDLSLIISPVEMRFLKEVYEVPEETLLELPFMLESPDEEARNKLPSFDARHDYISIGNFRHPPNWDSVQYLKQTIWPLIRQRQPDARIRIYGAYPTKQATALHDPKSGFFVEGWANDAEKVMQQARVCLAPLRFGAGLKGKLALAMQCGTPSVTTPVGAEGMHGTLAWSGLIESDAGDLADAAVRLYQDPSAWALAQHNGWAILHHQFSPQQHGAALIERLHQQLKQRDQLRSENFLQRLMNHHQQQSSRYMGLWIEAKNRLQKQSPD